MKLHKIYYTKVPPMQNTPCKVAVFTDGKGGIKVFQKMLWRSGKIEPWVRNKLFKRISDVERCVDENNQKASECERHQKRKEQFYRRNMGY